MSLKRKSNGVGLEDENRDPKRLYDEFNTTLPELYDASEYNDFESFALDDGVRNDVDMEWKGQCNPPEAIGVGMNSEIVQNNEIICYGAICDVKVKLDCQRLERVSFNSWEHFHDLRVCQRGSYYSVQHRNEDVDLGILDSLTTGVLMSLQRWPEVELTAAIATTAFRPHAKKKTGASVVSGVSVNILGPKRLLDSVGDAVTNKRSHLQHPYILPAGMEYLNPHYFYPRGIRVDLRELVGLQLEPPEAIRFAQGLGDIFHSLADFEYSEEEGTSVDALNASYEDGLITTVLKRHQEIGVNFILSREERDIAASTIHTLQRMIGPREFTTPILPILGGIDADEMGLGKTLTMLSAIICTMTVASEFGRADAGRSSLPTTRATLIVASSPQVIEVWKSEIQRHLKQGYLSLCVFHGHNKSKTIEEFTNNDIVLTTYHTLRADQKSQGLLQRVMWFRVVLDEAHWIRNNTSLQFKAACSLTAQRRWCLTGTPIQNSLLDLRSLLEFLHFQPFSEPKFFQKHILDPLQSDNPESFRNLKALMRATCFRRTSDLLLLPETSTEEITTELNEEEQYMYDDIISASTKEREDIVSMRSTKKMYSLLFAMTMKLRRLCNHGTFSYYSTCLEISSPDTNTKKRTKYQNSVEEELLCAYCCDENENVDMDRSALEVCPGCSRVLANQAGRTALITPNSPFVPLTLDSGDDSRTAPLNENTENTQNLRPQLDMKSGFSSKLNAVVDNIHASPANAKHLVFTSWRDTLDILQCLLTHRGIECLRMDGQTSFPDRQTILDQFRQESTYNVLLLSIATGAVGLTLTVANRVHIVEPQWNPLIEEQAIGRAVRIGQERPVKVYKYITKRTVEQNIVKLQKRKSQLVKISLNACAVNEVQQGLDDLMFIMACNM
ncbi:SNF2 family N-terminal domain-containing protein [Astrocystis sublimbata]|nr:SNF2 family N-terminal domain-containing protein [Astrocystis sublimbata]